jgi:hypothetical protein
LKPDGEAVYGLKNAELHSEDKLRVAFGCAENSWNVTVLQEFGSAKDRKSKQLKHVFATGYL